MRHMRQMMRRNLTMRLGRCKKPVTMSKSIKEQELGSKTSGGPVQATRRSLRSKGDGMTALERAEKMVHIKNLEEEGFVKMRTRQFGASLNKLTMTSDEYKNAVMKAKEHIMAGDIFQIVVSQRFERQTYANPFEVYRALRILNPMYGATGCVLVASSPEILTRVRKGKIINRPLAGTVRRG
ncbi:hypothetical protein EJB05_35004 [Eragrostis curvula]|uniref:Chorismate-utilising enzyme C-terminal domain-containing protein n=1 Tax=Eragrostis curvula TaxID=38414 RepID=A0A5J9U5N3_9POAL|nr:hypothetical protein EJB05_35004 [Eragrostis curvula]